MAASSKLEPSEYSNLNKIVGWFIILRWIAWLGVLTTLVFSRVVLQYTLPYRILYILNGLLFLVNLFFTVYYSHIKQKNLSRRELNLCFTAQFCSDYTLLFFLVYFTGFFENPFIYYFVFHIMLTSFIYSAIIVYMYVGSLIVVIGTTFFAEYTGFIPHFSLYRNTTMFYFRNLPIRFLGLSTTLIICAYLVTSIKKRIEEKGKRVEVELDRYKSLDKIKSNFILQVTHELRGPLAALMGYHEMVMKGITREKNQKTMEVIQKANRRAKNLLTMIDEMIDYAYMKSEKDALEGRTDITLKEIIERNLDLFEQQANTKGLSIKSNCPKSLSLYINRDLLDIILNNLISNAIKYSRSRSTITVNAEETNGEIHLFVQDEGIGIRPDEINRIFEEFYRTRRARELDRDGTGLGLPIVQKAVQALNGRITVYSELEKGTSFHIYIPASKPGNI